MIGDGTLVLERVARQHGLRYRDLTGQSRERRIAWPRQEAMLILHAAGWSLPRIGRLLNRDHSTVLYGIEQATHRMERARRTETPRFAIDTSARVAVG